MTMVYIISTYTCNIYVISRQLTITLGPEQCPTLLDHFKVVQKGTSFLNEVPFCTQSFRNVNVRWTILLCGRNFHILSTARMTTPIKHKPEKLQSRLSIYNPVHYSISSCLGNLVKLPLSFKCPSRYLRCHLMKFYFKRQNSDLDHQHELSVSEQLSYQNITDGLNLYFS